ncbi:hypothetical protein CASFOL_027456 [Castilleja foliolosa]|uniref:Bacterial surface antigen (D15) domain-containing protein n=1 Tax=Castilleja foliolosa TaxID=1961234 RepID=A0ABD3CEW4_9LAMI
MTENGYDAAHVINVSCLETIGVFEVNESDIKNLGIKFRDKLGNICKGNTNVKAIQRALPDEVAVGRAFNQGAFEIARHNIESLNIFSAMIQLGHRNIKGLNRSFEGSITLSNLFDPEDDIDFNFDYAHPYLDGIDNPRNRTFRATCFSTKKLSPVFRGATGAGETPIWVDRKGVKATITEDYTKQSKFSYGLVVKTRDEEGNIAARGYRVSSDGRFRQNGPSTTLSGTVNDKLTFLQANLTRDNTRFVNGALVGARDRCVPGGPKDWQCHEAFTIGGPHSVRGYDIGEIGASRRKLEVAAEVRVPVKM